MNVMGMSVQARLDQESLRALQKLTKQLGWSPSKAVREGLRLLAAARLSAGQRTIIGLGKFKSGISDLGSNKAHLDGFGQ